MAGKKWAVFKVKWRTDTVAKLDASRGQSTRSGFLYRAFAHYGDCPEAVADGLMDEWVSCEDEAFNGHGLHDFEAQVTYARAEMEKRHPELSQGNLLDLEMESRRLEADWQAECRENGWDPEG